MGCYIHGLFANDSFAAAWAERIGKALAAPADFERRIDQTLDALAAHLEAAIDLDRLLGLAR
jgi:adenosylcobyric acid synthase